MEYSEEMDALPSPERFDTQTRQKSTAAVQTIDPGAVQVLAKFLDQ